jgi:hypothetical protein
MSKSKTYLADAQCCSILARQSASKVSELAAGAHAWDSIGSPGFTATELASCSPESACLEVCAGHSSDDFESRGLPSYQHFRPSMRRQDQYPCWFDGAAALHCCFACAVGIQTSELAVMQVAKIIGAERFVI